MKKFNKILTILCFILILCFSGGIALFAAGDAAPVSSQQTIEQFLQNAFYTGERYDIPKGYVTVDGVKRKADTLVHYPDGTVYRQNRITFEKEGVYTIEYRSVVNGEIYSEKHDITVKRRAYRFVSPSFVRSRAYYGLDSSKYATGHTGLTIELYQDEQFLYEDVIDLRKTDGQDFLKMFVMPDTIGYLDVEKVHIRLTDIYDENNYLDIYIWGYPVRRAPEDVPNDPNENWKFNNTYIQVGASNQIPVGLGWNADGSYTVNKKNLFGYHAAHSMYGYSNRQNSVGKEILNIGMSLAEKQIYSTNRIQGRSSLVADLDDVAYIDHVWEGFTTGEAYMSIKAFMYRDGEQPFKFMITQLGDKDLSREIIEDNTPPEIDVKVVNLTAYVGKKYPIPEAQCSDELSCVKRVQVSVYYNYNSSTRYDLQVTDKYFIPDKEGLYTIEYKATDAFNNQRIKTITVNAISGQTPDFSISLSDGAPKTGKVGQILVLAEPIIGGDTNVEIKKYIVFNSQTFQVQGDTYKFLQAGEYVVKYVATNRWLEQRQAQYKIIISNGSLPVFEADTVLPLYLIAGFDYVLPNLYAVDYNDGQIKTIRATVSIDVGGGYQVVKDNKFTCPDVDQVSIRYTASNKYGTQNVSYQLPVINVKDGDDYRFERYFVSQNLNATATEDYIAFTNSKPQRETYFIFANPLNAENLGLNFAIDSTKANFDRLNLYFYDYLNRDIAIKLSFEKIANQKSSLMRVNDGGKTFNVSAGFGNDIEFSLSYFNSTRVLSSIDFSVLLDKTLSGEKFKGFPSGRVYFKCELENVSGPSSIKVIKINQHVMNNSPVDYTRPTLLVFGQYKDSYSIGSAATILKAIALDVIDPTPSLSVTVKDPEGNVLTAKDGTKLENVPCDEEYTINLASYGNYLVSYSASDASGRNITYNYLILVEDEKEPEIINGGKKEFSAKVNKEFELPKISAKDDIQGDIAINAYIITPKGTYVPVDLDYKTVIFNDPGVYELRYIAMDVNGNVATVSYKITVTK